MRIALVLAALALAVVSDKTRRCMQCGKLIGVPPDQMDDYTKRCTLQ